MSLRGVDILIKTAGPKNLLAFPTTTLLSLTLTLDDLTH